MLDYTSGNCTYKSDLLHSTIQFESYSDARLAGLCLDDELPIMLLQKVLRVILDPDFKLQDVTFKNVWDIFRHVSDSRRENMCTRAVVVNSSAVNEHTSVVTRPGIIPPIILDFVVDRVLDERGSLTDTAPWVMGLRNAFFRNSTDFRNMSLVHRSWTPIAQRGLHKRVVVGGKNIKNFLLNPFCGPQVTEMIIDWKFTDGHSFPTESDIRLLDELLLRTPNVRSLAFNTSLASFGGDNRYYKLELEACMEIIAERLPRLENLWLAHYCEGIYHLLSPWMRIPYRCEHHHFCPGLPALYDRLPKLASLKFLSVRGWEAMWGSFDTVDWNAHLPAQLQTIELDYYQSMSKQLLSWLLKPRGGHSLESLSISFCERLEHDKTMSRPDDWQSGIKRLALYVAVKTASATSVHQWIQDLLGGCKELVSLDLCIERGYGFMENISLPPSLERLSVHYYDGAIGEHFPKSSELTRAGRKLVRLVRRNLPRLPRLRTLLVTARTKGREYENFEFGEFNENMGPGDLVQDSLPEQLLELCRDHGVEVNP